MAQFEESPVKHTPAGEMPETSSVAEAERRFEADLPLFSDPVVRRNLSIFLGIGILGIGLGVYFFRKKS